MKHLQYVVCGTCTHHHLIRTSHPTTQSTRSIYTLYRLPTVMRVYVHGHITFLFL
jgi:hypothetical protein